MAFFSEAFFGVEERIELIWHLYKKVGMNLSFNLKYKACTNAGSVREMCRFPSGVFCYHYSIYAGNSIASDEETF